LPVEGTVAGFTSWDFKDATVLTIITVRPRFAANNPPTHPFLSKNTMHYDPPVKVIG